jgi:Bacterial regulatory proteins, luxR family
VVVCHAVLSKIGKLRIYEASALRHSSADGESSFVEGSILKTTFPDQLGAAMIEGLSAALHGIRAQAFDRGMDVLRKHVPFHGAWWGLIEGPPDVAVVPSFHLAGSMDLSEDLLSEYAEICGNDSFAEAVVTHPNQVLRWSGTEDEVAPVVQAWVKRHQLAHGASMSSHDVFCGQSFIVALFRCEGSESFNDNEAILIRFLLEQLGLLWSHSLQEMMQSSTAESLSETLLSKPDGSLIYCGAAMALRLATLGWDQQGRLAPEALLQFGKTGGRLRIGEDWVVINSDEEGLRAQLASNDDVPPLPSRLLRVAALACDGLSAKEIARELDLSPATVRTYLRDTYNHLGVRNKLQLNSALNSPAQRRSTIKRSF